MIFCGLCILPGNPDCRARHAVHLRNVVIPPHAGMQIVSHSRALPANWLHFTIIVEAEPRDTHSQAEPGHEKQSEKYFDNWYDVCTQLQQELASGFVGWAF